MHWDVYTRSINERSSKQFTDSFYWTFISPHNSQVCSAFNRTKVAYARSMSNGRNNKIVAIWSRHSRAIWSQKIWTYCVLSLMRGALPPTTHTPIPQSGGSPPIPKRIHPSKPSNNYQSTKNQIVSDNIARDQIVAILLLRPFVVLPFQTIILAVSNSQIIDKIVAAIFYKY